MAVSATNDVIGNTSANTFSTGFDWANNYVSTLKTDGYERFSQLSATPSSTILYAGPARFSGLSGDTSLLTPIGLADGFQMQSQQGTNRMFEIGSDRSFFTVGKTVHSASLTMMLADRTNILAALTANSYKPTMLNTGTNAPGATAPNADIQMNLQSETFKVPFGMLVIFKTKGGAAGGRILSGLYLEYCMFGNYGFMVNSQAPVIQENVSIEFDRPVPVAFNAS